MAKTKLVNIRVSESERERMHEEARKRGLKLSKFVRLLVLQNSQSEVKNEGGTK